VGSCRVDVGVAEHGPAHRARGAELFGLFHGVSSRLSEPQNLGYPIRSRDTRGSAPAVVGEPGGSTSKATYVLAHCGGHGGGGSQRVARLLPAGGHDVYAPTLTGLGERSHLLRPGIDLDLHIRDITAVLHYDDLRDVILVGHSYGGMVITGVADRASDRVGRLVYLDAANPVNGQSLVDVAGPGILSTRPAGEVGDGVELVLLPSKTDPSLLYRRTHPARHP